MVEKVDMDRDVQALVAENSITTDDNKAEFLMTDYFVSLCFSALKPEGGVGGLSESNRCRRASFKQEISC